jgi:hypothetical protein
MPAVSLPAFLNIPGWERESFQGRDNLNLHQGRGQILPMVSFSDAMLGAIFALGLKTNKNKQTPPQIRGKGVVSLSS